MTGSIVYFLPWEDSGRFPEWLGAVGAFGHVHPRDYTALKIHFGEEGNTGHIEPCFVRPVADGISARGAWPFLTDANTIYVGERADAVHHSIIAGKHGFTLDNCGCPVIIADGLRGNAGVDVEVDLRHFKSVSIANAVHYADSLLFLSHFKGHELTGFGGALKNIGMGCGTRAGKYAMHDRVCPSVAPERCAGCGQCLRWCGTRALSLDNCVVSLDTDRCAGCGECILSCPREVFSIPWDENTAAVQEKIVEYACGVLKGKRHFSITFVRHVTRYCDCFPDTGKPLVEDIGILAGADPVALDQACADLVNRRHGGDLWKDLFPGIDWEIQLDYAERLGLGSRAYTLVRR